MNFDSPLDNQAARSALISTGVVGLTAGLVKHFTGKGLKVGLPVGLGTGLLADYLYKRHKNHAAVRTMNDHSWAFMHQHVDKAFGNVDSDPRYKGYIDRTWFEEQLTLAHVATGTVALAGAYKAFRYVRSFYEVATQPANILPLIPAAMRLLPPPGGWPDAAGAGLDVAPPSPNSSNGCDPDRGPSKTRCPLAAERFDHLRCDICKS